MLGDAGGPIERRRRGSRRSWIAIPALLGLAGVALAGDPAPPAVAGPRPGVDAEFQGRINAAIDRGARWLKTQQATDGWWKSNLGITDPEETGIWGERNTRLGVAALSLYALRTAGVSAEDECVARGFAWVRREYAAMRDPRKLSQGLRNYPVSLLVLALEANGSPPGGGNPGAAPTIADLPWLQELTDWLVRAQDSSGGFGYTSPIALAEHDHSNTQYSLLALAASRRCGIQVPRSVWERALKHLLNEQQREGPAVDRFADGESAPGDRYAAPVRKTGRDVARGWGYKDGQPATGSMTGGGVSSVALCREALLAAGAVDARLAERSERSIRDGLAWLGLHFTVKETHGRSTELPGGARVARAGDGVEPFHYYYLFGLERAGDLAGVRYMGEHDWYVEGAKHLLEVQATNGSWMRLPPGLPRSSYADSPEVGSTTDTAFALLFLKRAMLRGSRGTATEERPLDLSGAPGLDAAAFGKQFDEVFRRYAAALASGRPAPTTDFVRMGIRSVPLLILRLGDDDARTRAAAWDALGRVVPGGPAFDPGGSVETRDAAVVAWETWWGARGVRLVADVPAGAFVEK